MQKNSLRFCLSAMLTSIAFFTAFSQGEIQNSTFPYWKVKGNLNTDTSQHFVGTIDNVALTFRTNNIRRATINTNGNFGIGTVLPQQLLHIYGNNTVRIGGIATGGTFITAPAASTDKILFADANGDLRALANGSSGQTLTASATGVPTWTTTSGLYWGVTGNAGTNAATNFIGTTDAQAFVFRTTNVERARITSAGYMVVNNAAPFAGDMFSSYASSGNYAVNGYATGSGAAGYFVNSATGAAIIGFQSGTLGSAGQFTTSGASANTSTTVDIYNQTGSSPAVTVRTDLANASSDGMEMDINGAAAKRGIDMYVDAAVTGIGMTIFHDGTGRCMNLQQQSTTNVNPCFYASAAGAARVINATNALTTNTQMIGFFNQGSTGTVTATYGNASAVWGQSSGIRGGVFLAAGATANTTCLQGSYSGAAGNYDGVGVYGIFSPAALYGYGVVGQGSWYGVFANGDLGASGVKPFQIDHPLDPTNKYLKHFSIESNEVLNLYRGTVVLDAQGEATVTMPNYFQAININMSYNLTPIGAPTVVYIAQEIDANGTFKIAGGNAGQKICWNVYGDRNDKYVQQNPEKIQAEALKKTPDVGLYLMPELYNQPDNKGIFYRYRANPEGVTTAEPASAQQSIPAARRGKDAKMNH